MEILTVAIQKPRDVNLILGQAHFIKTVDDLHEALVSAAPKLKFGLGFCEASGATLVRRSGNDPELVDMAARQALAIGAGHSFLILLREGFPLNVLTQVKLLSEVCTVYCATANPVEVLIAETRLGRGILGVIDGEKPVGIESPHDAHERRELLRELGYKA